jgi:hypothetical protein
MSHPPLQSVHKGIPTPPYLIKLTLYMDDIVMSCLPTLLVSYMVAETFPKAQPNTYLWGSSPVVQHRSLSGGDCSYTADLKTHKSGHKECSLQTSHARSST